MISVKTINPLSGVEEVFNFDDNDEILDWTDNFYRASSPPNQVAILLLDRFGRDICTAYIRAWVDLWAVAIRMGRSERRDEFEWTGALIGALLALLTK